MKHTLFFIIFLLASIALSVDAKAEIFMKYGAVIENNSEQPTRNYAGIWFEQNNCKECLALFGIETYKNGTLDNRMAGLDYTYKSFQTNDSEIRLTIGYAIAEKPINNSQNFNFHLGAGFVFKKLFFNKFDFILSYDHFSNGRTVLARTQIEKNTPLDMLSLGVGF